MGRRICKLRVKWFPTTMSDIHPIAHISINHPHAHNNICHSRVLTVDERGFHNSEKKCCLFVFNEPISSFSHMHRTCMSARTNCHREHDCLLFFILFRTITFIIHHISKICLYDFREFYEWYWTLFNTPPRTNIKYTHTHNDMSHMDRMLWLCLPCLCEMTMVMTTP